MRENNLQEDRTDEPYRSLSLELTPDLGGEIGERIEEYEGEEYECDCGHVSYARPILGYEHDGGTPDANGKKWWMFVTCPLCGHQHAFMDLKRLITEES